MKRRDFFKATAALALPAIVLGVPVAQAATTAALPPQRVVTRAPTYPASVVEFIPRENKSFVLTPDPPFQCSWHYERKFKKQRWAAGTSSWEPAKGNSWLRLAMSLRQYDMFSDTVFAAGNVKRPFTICIDGGPDSMPDLYTMYRSVVLVAADSAPFDGSDPYFEFFFWELRMGWRGRCYS